MSAADPQNAAASTLPQRKFSRYRSVRRATPQDDSLDHPPPVPDSTTMAAAAAAAAAIPPDAVAPKQPATRSMSRYRQRANTAAAAAQRVPAVPSIQHHADAVQHTPPPSVSQPSALAANGHATPRPRGSSTPPVTQQHLQQQQPRTPRPLVQQPPAKEPSRAARDEARQLLAEEAERQRRMNERLNAERRARLEAEEAERARLQREAEETERAARAEREAAIRAQQQLQLQQQQKQQEEEERMRREREARDARDAARVIQREPLEREQPNKLRRQSFSHRPRTAPEQPEHKSGKFGLFRRRKEDPPPPLPSNIPEAQVTPRPRQISNPASNATPGILGNGNGPPPTTIKRGGGGAVPGIDAPISAVNAGDRRVLVERNDASILLPVTPTTTALDLLRSASTCLSVPIDPRYCVLLESFYKVGLHRPLRKYEHVRDIMNSWDDDNQNSLVIVDSATGGKDNELNDSNVPSEKPEGFSCWLYFSQVPGKWHKRWISLRTDGQMLVAKNESGKESTNICHLSDFDIYSPTQKQLQKKVKPPKKICFAIKSQQKSNMFMNTTNFVHFFCTADKPTGERFYQAVQGWRSWYLVNVMGAGQKTARPIDTAAAAAAAAVAANSSSNRAQDPFNSQPVSSHRHSQSVDSHYMLGSFAPLALDFSDVGKGNESTGTDRGKPVSSSHSRKPSMRARAPPRDVNLEKPPPVPSAPLLEPENAPFSPSGLLGRTYSQRQKAQREREAKDNSPFKDGPSLVKNIDTAFIGRASIDDNRTGVHRHTSVRSHHQRDSSDLKRNQSVARAKPKPLVDLTPQYREPPQHLRKGKGFIPDHVGPGGLIDLATTPEVPFNIPPSTDWRVRPTTSAGPSHHNNGPSYERTKSLRSGHRGAGTHAGYADDRPDAFTGRGLLAQTGFSQGGITVGHGVMDGTKAKGPMLDMREESRFLPGSLLASVERQLGPQGPVIDRERKSIEMIRTGEGY